jgi:phage shock protein PspC (stress-responsive transcriptional regulator)
MESLLYFGLVPVTIGGLAMYLKLGKTWLRILGLILFGAGLLCYLILPAVLRVPN